MVFKKNKIIDLELSDMMILVYQEFHCSSIIYNSYYSFIIKLSFLQELVKQSYFHLMTAMTSQTPVIQSLVRVRALGMTSPIMVMTMEV